MQDDIRHYSLCTCTSSDHTLHWYYHKQNLTEGPDYDFWPDCVMFDVSMSWTPSFFSRIKKAFLYVIGRGSECGHFDTFMLEKDEAKKLVEYLNEYINSREPTEKEWGEFYDGRK